MIFRHSGHVNDIVVS